MVDPEEPSGFCQHCLSTIDQTTKQTSYVEIRDLSLNRHRAKKGPAPPIGNFALSYLKENFKPHLLRDVCTLCSGALVSDSLLHMSL